MRNFLVEMPVFGYNGISEAHGTQLEVQIMGGSLYLAEDYRQKILSPTGTEASR